MLAVMTAIAAIGCGVVGGLFFAFSAFVMTALGRLPAADGMAAMRSINAAVLNPVFGLVFFGTTGANIALAVAGLLAGAPELVAGALLFVLGAFGVTVTANVPLNNALAAADPALGRLPTAEGERLWARYRTRWTAWNHVRTVAAIGAATVLTLALPS